MKVTVLIENDADRPELASEHGLSFLIEADGRTGMFDTGQSGAVVDNAGALGVDLSRLSWVALSHGHYDHANGLPAVLAEAPGACVYAHPAAFAAKCAAARGKPLRMIGIDASRDDITAAGARVHCSSEPVKISNSVLLTGEIPRETDFEHVSERFVVKTQTGAEPDLFPDDQALLLLTAAGVVVLLGCAHAGVVNTLAHVASLLPGRPVHAVIGGMHLGQASPERIARTIEAVRELAVALVAPMHCTGSHATAALRNAFGNAFGRARGGTSFEF